MIFKYLSLEINAPIWKTKDKNNETTIRKTLCTEKFTVGNYAFENFINHGSMESVKNHDNSTTSSSTSVSNSTTATENTMSSLVSANTNVSQVDDSMSSTF